ncbi:MAG: dolichyl-phosphate beta-glucosyltransferase [Acidobacteriota bacterium]
MSRPLLSVVIPAYNEQDRLQSSLKQIVAFLKSRGDSFELLVVDDGSTDRTARVAEQAADQKDSSWELRLLRNSRNRGKGYSVRRGMLESRGRYALLTDADLSAPIREFAKLESEVIEGACAIAIGSRDVEGSQVEIHQSRFRENSGKLFNLAVRCLLRLPFHDTQCGFKLFDLRACRKLFELQRTRRFGFAAELLFIARKMGLSIKEVAIVWRHSDGSKVHFTRDGTGMILDLFRIRWNQLRGKYRTGSAIESRVLSGEHKA